MVRAAALISLLINVADPYASDLHRGYVASLAKYKAQAAQAAFADRCGAFADNAQGQLVMQWLGMQLMNEAIEAREPLPNRTFLVEASAAGDKKAKAPNACAYWHEHPEKVAALRRLGAALEGAR